MLKDEDVRLVRFLFTKGYVDKVRFDKFNRMMGESDARVSSTVLIEAVGVDEGTVAQAISEEFQIPFVNLTPSIIAVNSHDLRDEFLRKYNALPIIRSGVELTVAFHTPPYKEVLDTMRREAKIFVVPVAVKRSAFEAVISKEKIEIVNT